MTGLRTVSWKRNLHGSFYLLAEKEVNELMEELFETVSDKLVIGLENRSFSELS